MVRELKADGTANRFALAVMLESYCGLTCSICLGDGHHAGECALMKGVNKRCEGPVLKKVWGAYKSSKRHGGRRTFIKDAAEEALNRNAAAVAAKKLKYQQIRARHNPRTGPRNPTTRANG